VDGGGKRRMRLPCRKAVERIAPHAVAKHDYE
jgi:hypothetical protein